MLVPSLWKHPPISGTDNISEPPFRWFFAGFSCLGDPPKSKTLLNVPPIMFFYKKKKPFLNFSGIQRERERKTTPFFKEISWWKVKYPPPPFFQFSGRTLSPEKYPFTRDFGNTHAVPPTPEWGGGGRAHHIDFFFFIFFFLWKRNAAWKGQLYYLFWERVYMYFAHKCFCLFLKAISFINSFLGGWPFLVPTFYQSGCVSVPVSIIVWLH